MEFDLDQQIIHDPLAANKGEYAFAQRDEMRPLIHTGVSESSRGFMNRIIMKSAPARGREIVHLQTEKLDGRNPELRVVCPDDSTYGTNPTLVVRIPFGSSEFITSQLSLNEFERIQTRLTGNPDKAKLYTDQLRRMLNEAFIANDPSKRVYEHVLAKRDFVQSEEKDMQMALIEYVNLFVSKVFAETCYLDKLIAPNKSNRTDVTPLEMIPDAVAASIMLARYFHNPDEGNTEASQSRNLQAQVISRAFREVNRVLDNQLQRQRGISPDSDLLAAAVAENFVQNKGSILPNPRNLLFVERVMSNCYAEVAGVPYISFSQSQEILQRYTKALGKFRFNGVAVEQPGSDVFGNELGGLISNDVYAYLISLHDSGLGTYSERMVTAVANREGFMPGDKLPPPSPLDLLFEAVVSAQGGHPVWHYLNNSERTESDLARLYVYMNSAAARGDTLWRRRSGSADLSQNTRTMEILLQMEEAAGKNREVEAWKLHQKQYIGSFEADLRANLPQSLIVGRVIEYAKQDNPEIMFDLDQDMVTLLTVLLSPDASIHERFGVEVNPMSVSTCRRVISMAAQPGDAYVKFAMETVQSLLNQIKDARSQGRIEPSPDL